MDRPLLPPDLCPEKAPSVSGSRPPSYRIWNYGDQWQLIACYVLHGGLVIAHIALLATALGYHGQILTMSIEKSERYHFTLLVTLILQFIGTVYLAGILVLTQKLALCREFHTRQTLSAIHDKSSAWLSLGSSAFSLWYQLQVPAAVSGVIQITSYLLGTFVLHITIPTIASVVVYNVSVPAKFPTKLAYDSNVRLTGPAYNILSFYNQLDTPGLDGSTIYDVIPLQPTAVGNASVNATTFIAICASLPDANQTSFDTHPIWEFDLGQGEFLDVYPLSYNSLTTTTPATNIRSGLNFQTSTMVYSTIPIIDASGRTASIIPINPVYNVEIYPESLDIKNYTITALQLIACDITLQNAMIDLDAQTGRPLSVPSSKGPSLWNKWTGPIPQSDPLLVSLLKQLSANSPLTSLDINAGGSAWIDSSEGVPKEIEFSFSLSALDSFIMEDLDVFRHQRDNVSLEELESSLENAVAAVTWYALNMNATSKYSGDADIPPGPPLQGEAIFDLLETRNRLALNTVPIAFGLAASCLLLALAINLTRRTGSVEPYPHVDSAGILELTWLLGNEPHINKVQEPQLQNLRTAGMFEIHLGERAKCRIKSESEMGMDP